MRTSIVYNILVSFSGEELKKLNLFLQSPYHNRSNNLLRFYNELVQYHPEYRPEEVTHQNLYSKLFPCKKFNVSTIRNLYSDLYTSILKYMEIENFSRTGKESVKFLLKELNRKCLNNFSGKIIKKIDEEKISDIDYSYFLFKQYIESYKYNTSYLNSKITGGSKLKTELQPLENSVIYLIYFFISELCSFYVNSKIYGLNYNILTDNLMPVKLLHEFSLNKLIKILPASSKYKFILKLYDSMTKLFSNINNNKLYLKYKSDFEKYSEYLSNDEKNMHTNYLISYCIHKRDEEGGRSYDEELFSLYVMMLENEYYRDSKTEYLPHELFRSILLEALRTGKYDWAWQFSEIYSAKLRPADSKNMKKLASAYISFETGNFTESLKYLNKINLDFFIFKLDVKNLTLKIFYELGYTEAAFSLIKTFKEYLRKNIFINREKKTRYLNFVKFTELLLLHKAGCKKSDLGYLRYRITNHKAIAFKLWIVEKLEQLETGYKSTA